MSNIKARPDRATVERIAREEAWFAGVPLGVVMTMRRYPGAKIARRRAMLRIIDETGCSNSGLAFVWGCDRQIPGRYARQSKAQA